MAVSKTTRILILLAIDSAFFLLELVVGYAVHSLALVADSFHMLNDVLSLCVGLWAVRATNATNHSRFFTYGFQRAETLGALINGVFLVALCLSIFLEAIQRFVEPQQVDNPKLVLIVGCFGLASNLIGLVLFHDHGHAHGHSHGHGEADAAEEGRRHATHALSTIADHPGNVTGGGGYAGFGDFAIHPASIRNEIINAARLNAVESDDSSGSEDGNNTADRAGPTESSPLLPQIGANPSRSSDLHDWHGRHKHNQPKDGGQRGGHDHGHGHSHGDLNMRGVFLHVMGDALGNIGVIASALVIWLTDFSWRFYSDPLISLIITIIILCSAVPLCKAASRILLQAAPANINLEDIEHDIVDLPGVISCHHLHVWQLSDTKLVASLHVEVEYDFKGQGSARYMTLARAIRRCLHAYGIHSSTIQPEFCLNADHNHSSADHTDHNSCDGNEEMDRQAANSASSRAAPKLCLLACGHGCADVTQCCPPQSTDATGDAPFDMNDNGGGRRC